MIKRTIFLISFFMVSISSFSQSNETDSNNFWKRVFLPSIDVGYQVPNSSLLEGSVRFGTSIEYRVKNNNDFFIRLNYDTYGAKYNLSTIGGTNNSLTNSIQGTVQFTDFLIAPGYRLGDNTWRIMFSVMPGIKLYEFPTATIDGQQVVVSQEGKSVFTTSALTTLEYYFDEKSAFTISLFQNQVWKEVDFWVDGGSAVGFSIGFITSLM